MKINIKDVLTEDAKKPDLHGEHWLTDAMESDPQAQPEPETRAESEPEQAGAEDMQTAVMEPEQAAESQMESSPVAEPAQEPELQQEAVEETLQEAAEEPRTAEPEPLQTDVTEQEPDEDDFSEEIPEAEALAEELTEEILPEESMPAAPQTQKTQVQEQLCGEKQEKHSFKKYSWAYGLAVAFVLLLGVTFAYTSLVPREVHATINGQDYKVETKAYTIGEFLDEQHIKYCADDYISRPVSTYIHDGIAFKLKHATDFKVTADGKTKKYKTLCRTVGDALKDCGIKVGDADIVTPGLETEIGDDLEVVIQRVTTKQETVEEDVKFNTIEKDDSSMNQGESKVVTEGVNGKDKVTYEITYIDGVESERKEVSRETVTAAVDKVIANGTKISFDGKSYSRKLVVKAYSYTGGGRTAMGTKARVGEIAVDPRVIPLGSKVYIEGVGARIAEDTGGNIKGNTIDIYMNSVSACRKWGVRTVTIYIE